MRQYEERMKELREEAEEEGIAVSEVSISVIITLCADATTPAQGDGSEPSRLLKHRDDTAPVDRMGNTNPEEPNG